MKEFCHSFEGVVQIVHEGVLNWSRELCDTRCELDLCVGAVSYALEL